MSVNVCVPSSFLTFLCLINTLLIVLLENVFLSEGGVRVCGDAVSF